MDMRLAERSETSFTPFNLNDFEETGTLHGGVIPEPLQKKITTGICRGVPVRPSTSQVGFRAGGRSVIIV
jgi:hypothetical protein